MQNLSKQKANFGDQEGRIFAGAEGTAIVTASNGGLIDTTQVTVINFTPTALSFVSIPGYANGVDVNESYAYVAAPNGVVVELTQSVFEPHSLLGEQGACATIARLCPALLLTAGAH